MSRSRSYDAVDGETRGVMVADPQTYGATKLWVVLKPIPIDCDDGDSPLLMRMRTRGACFYVRTIDYVKFYSNLRKISIKDALP